MGEEMGSAAHVIRDPSHPPRGSFQAGNQAQQPNQAETVVDTQEESVLSDLELKPQRPCLMLQR